MVRNPRIAVFWCRFDDTRFVILYHKSRGGVEDLVVHLPRDYSVHGGRHVLFHELVAVQLQPLVVGELCLLRLGAHGFFCGAMAVQCCAVRLQLRCCDGVSESSVWLSQLQLCSAISVQCERCSLRQVAR